MNDLQSILILCALLGFFGGWAWSYYTDQKEK